MPRSKRKNHAKKRADETPVRPKDNKGSQQKKENKNISKASAKNRLKRSAPDTASLNDVGVEAEFEIELSYEDIRIESIEIGTVEVDDPYQYQDRTNPLKFSNKGQDNPHQCVVTDGKLKALFIAEGQGSGDSSDEAYDVKLSIWVDGNMLADGPIKIKESNGVIDLNEEFNV